MQKRSTADPKLDVNRCSLDELLTVPGVGHKNGQDLIAARPFSSWKDVRDKLRGFGPQNQAWMEPFLMFGDTEAKQPKRRTRRPS